MGLLAQIMTIRPITCDRLYSIYLRIQVSNSWGHLIHKVGRDSTCFPLHIRSPKRKRTVTFWWRRSIHSYIFGPRRWRMGLVGSSNLWRSSKPLDPQSQLYHGTPSGNLGKNPPKKPPSQRLHRTRPWLLPARARRRVPRPQRKTLRGSAGTKNHGWHGVQELPTKQVEAWWCSGWNYRNGIRWVIGFCQNGKLLKSMDFAMDFKGDYPLVNVW